MKKLSRDFTVGLVVSVMLFASGLAEADPVLIHANPPQHLHDPNVYAYDDTCCYSDSQMDDMIKLALNDSTDIYGQKGWCVVTPCTARYWSRSLGNGYYHDPALTGPSGHHRTHMVTWDYDCAITWNNVGAFPSSIHPAPGAACIGTSAATTSVAFWNNYPHIAQAPLHDFIGNFHIYLKIQNVNWYEGNGTIGSNLTDVWATLEHELGHAIAGLGHFAETNDTLCPSDEQRA